MRQLFFRSVVNPIGTYHDFINDFIINHATLNIIREQDTECPTKHDSWWIVLNVFFHNLLSSSIQKRIVRNIAWQSFYRLIDFKVKYIWVKEFVNKINWKKSIISNIIYGKRHSKPFTNVSCFVGHAVYSCLIKINSIQLILWNTLIISNSLV